MITSEKLKKKYEEIKKLHPNKEMYLIGWLDCILYILGELKND